MKKVMLIAIAAMFSMTMFAQAQDQAKPVEKKKEAVKTEAVKTAKPAKEAVTPAKETAKPAKKTKEVKPAK
jgi:hypothetical protein